MQPFDYRLQVQDPFKSVLGAVQLGESLASIQAKRQQAAIDQQAMQQAIERKNKFDTHLTKMFQSGIANATAEDFAIAKNLTDKDTAKTLEDTFGMLTKDEQQQTVKRGAQLLAALTNNRPELAEKMLTEREAVLTNAGNEKSLQEAASIREQIKLLKTNPEVVRYQYGYTLAALPEGQKALESILKLEEAPAKLEESRAKAKEAAVKADFATATVFQDLNLKAAQIENYAVDAEVARANLKINALNADLKREENTLKRKELEQKIADAQIERDDKVRKKVSDANTAFANFDNFLNTADRALAGWGKDKSGKIDITKPKGYVESATGPISTRLPTLSQDTADFEEQIESLKSQAFLSQVEKMKGLGALSEKEGAALQAALTNLSLRQSPEQLGKNLMEAQRLILKGRDEAARKYGVSAAPDRPAGPGGAAPATVPSAMGTATDRAVAPAMPSGFRVLGRE